MQLNNTSQYAIRVLCYIAKKGTERLLSAKELSEVLDIPYKFLTKIMTDLAKFDFVISIRGREGGFKLARNPKEISIMSVLNALNEFVDQEKCILGIGTCSGDGKSHKCILHDQWAQPKELITKMYENTTLSDVENFEFKT